MTSPTAENLTGKLAASSSASFAYKLQALKAEGRQLARLHRDTKQTAAGRLPRLGALLDAEEELCESLSELCTLSPLLLVDGSSGVGKSSLLNALLLGAEAGSSSSACSATALPIGRPGARGSRPIIVRPLSAGITGRRCLEGKPSLSDNAEALVRVLTDEEWSERLSGTPSQPTSPERQGDAEANVTTGEPALLTQATAAPENVAADDASNVNAETVGSAKPISVEASAALEMPISKLVAETDATDGTCADAPVAGTAAITHKSVPLEDAEAAEIGRDFEATGVSAMDSTGVVETDFAAANTCTSTVETSMPAEEAAANAEGYAGGHAAAGDADVPLILEDAESQAAFGTGLWLTEVDGQDTHSAKSNWISGCTDVICMVRAAGGGSLSMADEARVRRHLEAARSLLLVVNHCDLELEPPIPGLSEVEALSKARLSSLCDDADPLVSIHAVSLLRVQRRCQDRESNLQQDWLGAWASCRQSLRSFACASEERRLKQARNHLATAREAFVHWCSTGAKVVVAANTQFQEDAETVRLARDIITRNIDAAYLAHFFSSVLVGKFDSVCKALLELPAPELGSAWGQHTTRRVMEDHLKKELEVRLRTAMVESLQAVTVEMAKQELPALEQIRRVVRRGADVPWDAEVRKLELDLRPDKLQHFAAHFFGSVAVGVLSGLGAAALEMLLAELVLGPVGVVAGIATFVVMGAQTADWPSVRKVFVKNVRTRQLELVEKARLQLDFPGLCERRRLRIIEQMDVVLQRLLKEVGALSDSSSEFARCAMAMQSKNWQTRAGNKSLP